MRDYLSLQAARSVGSVETLHPRLPSIFEPVANEGYPDLLAEAPEDIETGQMAANAPGMHGGYASTSFAKADAPGRLHTEPFERKPPFHKPSEGVHAEYPAEEKGGSKAGSTSKEGGEGKPPYPGSRFIDTQSGGSPPPSVSGSDLSGTDNVVSVSHEIAPSVNAGRRAEASHPLRASNIPLRYAPSTDTAQRAKRAYIGQRTSPNAPVLADLNREAKSRMIVMEGGRDGARPSVNVTIGRIEVRAVAGQEKQEKARSARLHDKRPRLSLEDYLKRGGEK